MSANNAPGETMDATSYVGWQLTRRELLKGAAGAGLLLGGGGLLRDSASAQQASTPQYQFPKDFLWGAGTAGLQHEGSPLADGAGESMWYRWAHTPGNVPEGETFDVTADQYRRFRSDIRLMRELNLNAYNFEIYWPRILPEGTGRVNEAGLDSYDRLVDEFLKAGITPLCNLFVHDHPAALEDRGGWLNRDSAEWFADYAAIVFRRLGDRVKYWSTICEIHILNQRFRSELRDPSVSLRAKHHLLLGQGRAVQAFRASPAKGQIGNEANVVPFTPASNNEADVAAAQRAHAYWNLLLLDSQLRGEYPKELIDWYGKNWPADAIKDADLATIAAPIDFFGINYYRNRTMRYDPSPSEDPFSMAGLAAATVSTGGTGDGLHDALVWVRDRYGNRPMVLHEIGYSVQDTVTPEGQVHDPARIAYLRDLLTGANRAIKEGVNLRGVFIWSFVDGWEFARGLSARYGLVYVDYKTQERIVKASGLWYRNTIASNGFNLPQESRKSVAAPSSTALSAVMET